MALPLCYGKMFKTADFHSSRAGGAISQKSRHRRFLAPSPTTPISALFRACRLVGQEIRIARKLCLHKWTQSLQPLLYLRWTFSPRKNPPSSSRFLALVSCLNVLYASVARTEVWKQSLSCFKKSKWLRRASMPASEPSDTFKKAQ